MLFVDIFWLFIISNNAAAKKEIESTLATNSYLTRGTLAITVFEERYHQKIL